MNMEVLMSCGLIIMVVVLMATWAWKALVWLWFRPKRLEKYLRKQGLSGNSYRILFGDMKEMNSMNNIAQSKPIDFSSDILHRVAPFYSHILNKYGKNCFIWRGPQPTIILMDPKLVKEVLLKFKVFRKPRLTSLVEVLVSGLVHHESEKWVKHRTLLAPAYRLEKLKEMSNAFYISCEKMIKDWEFLISTKSSTEVEMWDCCLKLSRDMLARAAFGIDFEEGKIIFILQQEQISLALQALRSVYIPGSRYLPTKFNRRMKQIEHEMERKFQKIIKNRENAMKRGEVNDEDLLGSYMTLSLKKIQENENNKAAGLSVVEIIEECKAFYLAGENASSVLILWTIVMLSKHQDWQIQARNEVLHVFGKNKPDFDGLNNQLKIVTMILHEVLRLYPPAMTLHRMTHEETQLGDLFLPTGITVILSPLLLHHDPELWGNDVNEFKPERFSQGVLNATNNNLLFFPFSSGPRTCIGHNFAMIEAKMALSMILQRFSLELSPTYTHAPYPGLTLQPQHGAHIVLHKI